MKILLVPVSFVLAASSMVTLGCGSGTDDVLTDSGSKGPPDASDAVPTGDDDGGGSGDAGGFVLGDDSGFTGRSSDGGLCRPNYASGVNVAWVHFASDVPHPDLATFQVLFQNTRAAGGRVARWWFHTNGTQTPGYDTNGMALPISDANIADVKSILDTARAAGMMVTISLWSFDMLTASAGVKLANNVSLLTMDANRQAYIDNVLTPLVTKLAGYPGLYSWETFNEPEGMASGGQGWRPFSQTHLADGGLAGQVVDESFIQKTVNWFAAAIHNADPSALVTNGTWEFQAAANVTGMKNYYSDAELVAAGGLTNGTLDYYEVHYYSADGSKYSPFINTASYWGLDKPVVIGEFYALAQDGVAAADTYTSLHAGGYAGSWAWQYLNSDGTNKNNGGMTTEWPVMQVPLENLYALTPNDVDCP